MVYFLLFRSGRMQLYFDGVIMWEYFDLLEPLALFACYA